jgi:hypothetical protein
MFPSIITEARMPPSMTDARMLQQYDCAFRGVQNLPFDMELKQITDPVAETVSIELFTPKQAWLALGFGTQMVGSTAVVGLPGRGVGKVFLGGKDITLIQDVDGSNLENFSIQQDTDGTTLRFTKPLVEDGENSVGAEGRQAIIVAAGFNNDFAIHEDYAPLTVDIDSCLLIGGDAGEVTETPTASPVAFDADELDCTLRRQLTLTSGVTLKEATNPIDKTVTVEMTYESDGAWIGVALASNGFMVGNTAVIGLPDEPVGPNNPAKYFLGGKSVSAVNRLPADQQTLTNTNLVQNATHTVMTFTKPLEEEGELSISATETNAAIFATGRGNSLSDGIHVNFGAFSLALTKCLEPGESPDNIPGNEVADLFNDEAPNKGLWQFHGLLMGVGWGLMVPLAIGAALTRSLFPPGGLWFKIHRGLNTAAITCIIIGFFIAIYLINDATAPGEDARHFRDIKHRKLGLVIVLFGVAQAASGFLRPHAPHAPAKEVEEDKDGAENAETTEDQDMEQVAVDTDADADAAKETKDTKKEEEVPAKTLLRSVWEYQHRILGTIVLIMAWANISSGLTIFSNRFEGNDASNGFWVWIVLLIVAIGSLTAYSKSGRSKK